MAEPGAQVVHLHSIKWQPLSTIARSFGTVCLLKVWAALFSFLVEAPVPSIGLTRPCPALLNRLDRCTFEQHKQVPSAPVVLVDNSSPSFSRCTFRYNQGRVLKTVESSSIRLDNSEFSNNSAVSLSGSPASPLWLDDQGFPIVESTEFKANQGFGTEDSALTVGVHTTLTILNSNFTDNYALFGAAIHVNSLQPARIHKCHFVNNSVSMSAGAIKIASAANITNSIFLSNSAQAKGGVSFFGPYALEWY